MRPFFRVVLEYETFAYCGRNASAVMLFCFAECGRFGTLLECPFGIHHAALQHCREVWRTNALFAFVVHHPNPPFPASRFIRVLVMRTTHTCVTRLIGFMNRFLQRGHNSPTFSETLTVTAFFFLAILRPFLYSATQRAANDFRVSFLLFDFFPHAILDGFDDGLCPVIAASTLRVGTAARLTAFAPSSALALPDVRGTSLARLYGVLRGAHHLPHTMAASAMTTSRSAPQNASAP